MQLTLLICKLTNPLKEGIYKGETHIIMESKSIVFNIL